MQRILDDLRRTVRREHFEPWFRELRLASSNAARCVFTVPSGFVRDWLRRNYLTQFAAAVRAVPGFEHCAVSIEVESAVATPARDRLARSVKRYDARSVVTELAADGTYGAGVVVVTGALRGPVPIASTHSEPDFGTLGQPSIREDSHAKPSMNQPRDVAPERDTVEGERTLPVDRGALHVPKRLGDAPNSCELNANYTFDQFVVGPCNRLSHAAALAVGDNPGRAYNPLFVHGNVGLGKTHLLQAICHEIRRKDEHARVLYLSCEEFTNRFIHAIQAGRLDDFRNLHRTADVLVIDDIQFLAGKDKTQDEFFHTFNSLYNANRQIVLSSDRPPSEIPTVEERLVSRFKWGLVVEMEVPCLETRAAIVKRKARARQIDLAEDVAIVIARRIDTNIRELEGAITKVLGIAQITGRPITVELVEEALRGVISQRSRPIAVADVVNLVSTEFSIAARELTGKGRAQTVSQPRQICMYLLRQVTDLSYEEIGGYFGDRDHTTVLYAVKRMERRTKEDRMFRDLVHKLMSRLRG